MADISDANLRSKVGGDTMKSIIDSVPKGLERQAPMSEPNRDQPLDAEAGLAVDRENRTGQFRGK